MHCDQASTSLGSDKLTGLFAGNHNEQEKDRSFRHDFLKAQDFGNRVYSEVDLTCFCQAYHRDYTSESLHAVVEAALVATSCYGTFIKDVRLAATKEAWSRMGSSMICVKMRRILARHVIVRYPHQFSTWSIH